MKKRNKDPLPLRDRKGRKRERGKGRGVYGKLVVLEALFLHILSKGERGRRGGKRGKEETRQPKDPDIFHFCVLGEGETGKKASVRTQSVRFLL